MLRHYLILLFLVASLPILAQNPTPVKNSQVIVTKDTSQKPSLVRAQSIAPITGEPVMLNKDTLFKLYAGMGILNLKQRVAVIDKRISLIVSRRDFNADSLVLKNDSALSVITYKSALIFTINDRDASFSELDRLQLAESYLVVLKQKSGNVPKDYTIKVLAVNALEAIAVIVGLLFLILMVNRAFGLVKHRSSGAWERYIRRLGEKGAPVGYAVHLRPVFSGLLRISRLIIIVLLVYIALPVAFLIFPQTKHTANKLLSYILKPFEGILLAMVHYLPKLLTVAVIYIVTFYLVKLVKFIAAEIENGDFAIKNFYPEWAIPTYNIIRILLYTFMFVIIFPYLPGSDSRVFQGVTLFFGVLFSFGSSSAISNIVAGIVLTYMRPFKIGDRVRVGEVTGDVIEKNLLITRIRTSKNEDITVPNSTILNGSTINYSSVSQELGLILNTNITISYDTPWNTVYDLLIEAGLATEGILKDPRPFVLQISLNDFHVTYQLNAYTAMPNKMSTLYSRLHQNIQDKFNEAGIEIMSPHFTALRRGNVRCIGLSGQ